MINFKELYDILDNYTYIAPLPKINLQLWTKGYVVDVFEKCIDDARINKELTEIEFKIFSKDSTREPIQVKLSIEPVQEDCGCDDCVWLVNISCEDWIEPEPEELDVEDEVMARILAVSGRYDLIDKDTSTYRDPIQYYIHQNKEYSIDDPKFVFKNKTLRKEAKVLADSKPSAYLKPMYDIEYKTPWTRFKERFLTKKVA